MYAFATVGLTVGATSHMQAAALCVTMLTMLIGRVGPVTMALTLSARPGEKRGAGNTVAPQAQITVG